MLRETVLRKITERLPGQTFSLRKVQNLWTPEEANRFEQELEFLADTYSLKKLVDGYVWLTDMTIRESKYFHEHGEYRYHSFEEVNRNVYADEETMTLCMLGLSLSEYLWQSNLQIHRFYQDAIQDARGENYLEIGPGHGKYFCAAYNLGQFRKYTAIDISPTAIAMTERYMKRYAKPSSVTPPREEYELICQDATQLDPVKQSYDFVSIQEVLEHLEDPQGMLRKIGELLTPEGRAYALMPICAPSAQHIFLFKSRAHVRSIVTAAGLEIIKEEYITANHIPVEEAEIKQSPIDACLLVKKK